MLADARSNFRVGTGIGRLALVLILLALAACGTTGTETVSSGALGNAPAIAVQPPIGLPGPQTARLAEQLGAALQRRSVALAPAPDAPARFRLQGFCSAADGGASTSVACIWDANTPAGERATRIVTEETVRGANPANPWSVVAAPTIDRIADTAADRIAAWLASAGSGSSPVAASGESTLSRLGLTSGPANSVALTGVSGAPGDGNQSLARAMTSALRSRNIPVSRANPNAYRLAGTVALGPVRGGNQDLTIDWTLSDARGATLGTVNQRNTVPAGALDGTWGATADSSAGAAADGIVDLIPG